MKNKEQHTWVFPSKGLKAIYDVEISGQLSDGAWENSTPWGHYKFWGHLNTEAGKDWEFKLNKYTDFQERYPKKKNGYNLLTLVDTNFVDLSSRMRAYYVDAELGIGLARDAEYLIDGSIDYIRKLATGDNSQYWKDKLAKHEAIDPIKVEAFKQAYNAYTRDHLIADLKLIKKQMKVVIDIVRKS